MSVYLWQPRVVVCGYFYAIKLLPIKPKLYGNLCLSIFTGVKLTGIDVDINTHDRQKIAEALKR